MQWSVRAHGDAILLSQTADSLGDRGVLPGLEAAWWIESLPQTAPALDTTLREDLARIVSSIDGDPRARRMSLDELRSRIADALKSGRLFGARSSRPMRVQRETPLEVLGPESVEEVVTKKTFVALELVDQDGEPVVGRRFRVVTGNDIVHEGTTNAEGKARVRDVDPGTCRIVFPEIYPEDFDWKPAVKGTRDAAERGPVLSSFHSGEASPTEG